MNRITRILASWIGIAAVLFAQLAVSAYACPMQFMGLGEAAATTLSNQVELSQANSIERDEASPALCQKHCQDGQQNVNDTPQPVPAIGLENIDVIPLVVALAQPGVALPPLSFLQRATAPPHTIRNCCFRI